jgi:hypothetical protein
MFDFYTTPPQQLHNTPSHGSGPHTLDPTPCEGMLCNCCDGVVNLLISIYKLMCSGGGGPTTHAFVSLIVFLFFFKGNYFMGSD